jgi:hypothetical protein
MAGEHPKSRRAAAGPNVTDSSPAGHGVARGGATPPLHRVERADRHHYGILPTRREWRGPQRAARRRASAGPGPPADGHRARATARAAGAGIPERLPGAPGALGPDAWLPDVPARAARRHLPALAGQVPGRPGPPGQPVRARRPGRCGGPAAGPAGARRLPDRRARLRPRLPWQPPGRSRGVGLAAPDPQRGQPDPRAVHGQRGPAAGARHRAGLAVGPGRGLRPVQPGQAQQRYAHRTGPGRAGTGRVRRAAGHREAGRPARPGVATARGPADHRGQRAGRGPAAQADAPRGVPRPARRGAAGPDLRQSRCVRAQRVP